jgi:hypothetical protein
MWNRGEWQPHIQLTERRATSAASDIRAKDHFAFDRVAQRTSMLVLVFLLR